MKFLQPIIIAPRNRFITIAGGLLFLFVSPLMPPPAFAQDQMMRRDSGDRGGDHGRGMGGLGGIGVNIMTHQLGQSPQAVENPKATKKTTTKRVAKKPLPKDEQKHQNAHAPEKPQLNKADGPPPQIPTTNPVPTVSVPGPPETPSTPPTTTGTPPQTTDGPPINKPPVEPPPPGSGVPPTQTTSAPPIDQPPSTQRIYGHDKGEDCPQRGMGCTALIIDYFEAQEGFVDRRLGPPGVKPLANFFGTDLGCDVEYVTPVYKAIPQPYRVKLENGTTTVQPYEDELKEVKEYNKEQYNRVTAAISRHRARIRSGTELAVEILNGHGSESPPACGAVGHDEGRSINRAEFHAGNYQAIYDNGNHHACGWFVADFSCYSGLTPEVVDELNNKGKLPIEPLPADLSTARYDPEHGRPTETRVAACKTKPGNNCAMHAAYDYDLAVGQAPADFKTCGLLTSTQMTHLINAFGGFHTIDIEEFGQTKPGQSKDVTVRPSTTPRNIRLQEFNFDSLLGFRSHYSDQGYRYCDPQSRGGIWPGQ